MSSSYDVLIDSDIFVALHEPYDILHKEAKQLLAREEERGAKLVTTNLVIMETATVLSNRVGQDEAKRFLEEVSHVDKIFIDEDLERETHKLFKQQKGRGYSMVDCANAVVLR